MNVSKLINLILDKSSSRLDIAFVLPFKLKNNSSSWVLIL